MKSSPHFSSALKERKDQCLVIFGSLHQEFREKVRETINNVVKKTNDIHQLDLFEPFEEGRFHFATDYFEVVRQKLVEFIEAEGRDDLEVRTTPSKVIYIQTIDHDPHAGEYYESYRNRSHAA